MGRTKAVFACCIFALIAILLTHSGCGQRKEEAPKAETETVAEEKDTISSAEFEEAEEDTRFIYEPIGWIELFKTREGEVRRKLGKPDSTGAEYQSQIDGCFVQDLYYRSKGIILEMASRDEKGQKQVSSILVRSPCTLKTEKGIGIGSNESDIWEKYEGFINKKYSGTGQNVLLGNIYGGTFFNIEEGKVVSIFVGAAAE